MICGDVHGEALLQQRIDQGAEGTLLAPLPHLGVQPTQTGNHAVKHFIDLADDNAQRPAAWAAGEFLDFLQQLAVGLL